ncbi:MAG: hypothetical protein A2Y96_02925 [Firmicutes bacterium RBG_13_65_8]|nr:MAG: hypothetical protein A2Y96_02925 [Firmicutes bacterium RBG_13_65_8]
MLSSDASCPAEQIGRVLQAARALSRAVEAGDTELVLKEELAYQAAFAQVSAGSAGVLAPSEAEMLLSTLDRTAAFLRGQRARVEADIRALRSWRRCLAGYRLPAHGQARFVDRQG